MQPPQATLDLYSALQRQGLATSLLVAREWQSIDPYGDWAGQWDARMPRVNAIVSAGRVGAARLGAASVPATLEESGWPELQDGQVDPAVFAGWAGSGRPMNRYLASPVRVARQAVGSELEMLAAGGRALDGLVRTAIADAGRGAASVAITSTKNAGYIRYEPAPYCQRCAPLVGKFYRWNTGFLRHPRCDAVHIAVSAKAPEDTRWTASLEVDLIKDLTDAQRRAIDDGADINRVINAYRRAPADMRERTYRTSERSRDGQRLTPEAIYQAAGEDRNRAVNMLRRHGYIT